MTACTAFLLSPNPRTRSCCRCGRPEQHHVPEPTEHPAAGAPTRARDLGLERYLMDIAAKAAGCTMPDPEDPMSVIGDDRGLSAFADVRAWPGGVRADVDGVVEASEEFADARNYLLWEIERIYSRVIEGEPESLDRYSQLFGALSALVVAWHALHRVPS